MDNSGERGIIKKLLKEEPQKIGTNFADSGYRPVGIVRTKTKATELVIYLVEGKISNRKMEICNKISSEFSISLRTMEQTPYFPQPIYQFNLNSLIIQTRVD
jgi:hypothetical protein